MQVDPGVARPCFTAVVLSVLVGVSGVRGADYPGHFLRALVWERSGISIWNNYWYAGHNTVSYGVLSPPLSAVFGPSSWQRWERWAPLIGSRLTQHLTTSSAVVANYTFAVVAIVNVGLGGRHSRSVSRSHC
jgi:hypothetical protein